MAYGTVQMKKIKIRKNTFFSACLRWSSSGVRPSPPPPSLAPPRQPGLRKPCNNMLLLIYPVFKKNGTINKMKIFKILLVNLKCTGSWEIENFSAKTWTFSKNILSGQSKRFTTKFLHEQKSILFQNSTAYQCWESGSAQFGCFWASRIWDSDPLVRCMVPDPDPSPFSWRCIADWKNACKIKFLHKILAEN